MEPTSPELDTIADLLRRWQTVSNPMERVRVVSDAADALRSLSALDARTLAQGLWEHGAGPAAQQVADRAGATVEPEELTQVASAVLALDRAEVDRLAAELRDPEQRRRLLVQSGVPVQEATRHVASTPPHGQQRIDAPPPPSAAPPGSSDQGTDKEASPPIAESNASPPAPPPPAKASSEPRSQGVAEEPPAPAARQAQGATADQRHPVVVEPPDRSPQPGPSSGSGLRGSRGPGARLADRLHDAPNGRERLSLLDHDQTVVQGPVLLQILDAVPDGWQRRTILRRLVTADRIRDLPAAEVVANFARPGDRFAAAALLVRTAQCDVEAVLPALDASDAARLRRRANPRRSDRNSIHSWG